MWTLHPRMVVMLVLGLPKSGGPVACSPVQVTQVREFWAWAALWTSLGSSHKVPVSLQTAGQAVCM